MICASEILPGPAIIITSAAANKIKSNSTPLSPVILAAPLTWKIAPTIIIEIKDADNLLSTPTISKIPGTSSASAIGICNSTGNPMFGKKFANPGSNFDIPCSMKIIPMADLKPINTASLRTFSLISLPVNTAI